MATPNFSGYEHISPWQMDYLREHHEQVYYDDAGRLVGWHPGVPGGGPIYANVNELTPRGAPAKNLVSSVAKDPNAGGGVTNAAGVGTLTQLLTSYNLQGLIPWAIKQLQQGSTADEIEINMRQQPAWQKQYWMITQRQKQGLPPISETDVINYMDTAHALANQYGVSSEFLDDHTLGTWIANDKSTSELQSVLQQGYDAVSKADPAVRQWFSQNFGTKGTDQALTEFFTDPEKSTPLLLQQAQAAIFGGNASRYGINLSSDDAMTLAQAGVTTQAAETGFQNVDQLSSLFQQNVGDTYGLSKEQGVQARLLGNAQELDVEQQKGLARAAGAKGKVGVEENPQKGFEGLGSSF